MLQRKKIVQIIPQTQKITKVQIVKKLNLTSQEEDRESVSYQDLKAEEELEYDDDQDEDDDEEEPQLSKKLISSEESLQQDPFLNFVNTYSQFMNEAHSTILDLDSVLDRMNEAIKKCQPTRLDVELYFISDSRDLQQFHENLMINSEQVTQLAQQLKQLPDVKLFQCVQNVEKLNVKLQLDYNVEVKKGRQLGIIKNDEEK